MRGLRLATTFVVLALLAAGCAGAGGDDDVVTIGAIYPTGGGQGVGGLDEYHGVELAADFVNDEGGVDGRRLALRLEPADSADAVPGAMERLDDTGVDLVLGSYGSTISAPAAEIAGRRGMLFWETGAVGELMVPARGERVFRFAPTGGSLGRAAVSFVQDQLAPRVEAGPDLAWSVAYVDDAYGRSVGEGALAEIDERGLDLGTRLPYALASVDYDDLATRVAAAGTDVLVVAAYLEDGVALRRALMRNGVKLVASIGTSSSYCMHEFGQALGDDAVGLFASDKPDGEVLAPGGLAPEAAKLLRRANAEFERRHGKQMSGAALSGFSAAWALFHHVLPTAGDTDDPEAVEDAVRRTQLPAGSLPNGSGLRFGAPGSSQAGENLAAASVIWEWVAPETRAVVWPPAYATSPILPLRPA